MSAGTLKRVGIACFVLSAVLLLVSMVLLFTTYRRDAARAKAGNEMMSSSSASGMHAGMTAGDESGSGVSVTTKFSLFFAVIASIGGIVCFNLASKKAKKVKKARQAAAGARFSNPRR